VASWHRLADSGRVAGPAEPRAGVPGDGSGNTPEDPVANIPLTIGSVSRLLGVAASTLRTWDRRYALGPSERTDGQHRRYSRVDVARLALVRQLTLRGAPPAEAARAALATPASAMTVRGAEGAADLDSGPAESAHPTHPANRVNLVDPAHPVPDRTLTGPHTLPGDLFQDPTRAVPATDGSRWRDRATAAPLRLGRVSAQARGLARAVLAMDGPVITEVMTDGVERLGVVSTWDSIVSPVLIAVGRRWELTGDGIEVEHLLSEAVLSVMSHRAASLTAPPSNSRPVLLAATAAEVHVLSLYAVSAAMAERRVSARVLGARVPGRALASAVARVVPSAVFLWAQSPATARVDPVDLLGSELTPGLVVGGPGWDPAAPPAGALHAGTLARAVDLLCALAV